MTSILVRFVAVALLLTCATTAFAQPSLSSLWPLEVGREWDFDGRVEGASTGTQTGTYRITVAGQIALFSGATAACFDLYNTILPGPFPGLMDAMAAREVYVAPSLLLSVPTCGADVGVLIDEEVATGTWDDGIGGWTWWWLPADLTPGSAFRLPVPTDRASDVFINGVVRTITGVVTTPAGSFTNAVIVDYVFEVGEVDILQAGVGVIGSVTSETVGWVAFVPDVGPVAVEETTTKTEIDCPECPASLFDPYTNTLELRATVPLPTNQLSVGTLKTRY